MAPPRFVVPAPLTLLLACASAPPAPAVPPPARDDGPPPNLEHEIPSADDVEAHPEEFDSEPPQTALPSWPEPVAGVLSDPASVVAVEIEIAPDGSTRKVAVVHRNAARVPGAVRTIVEETFPKARTEAFEIEIDADDGLVHEVEVTTADGRRCEVAVREDGTRRYTECEVRPKALPKPVREAARGRGTIVEAEEKRLSDGSVRYELELERPKAPVLVLYVDEAGRVLSEGTKIDGSLTVGLPPK